MICTQRMVRKADLLLCTLCLNQIHKVFAQV